MNTLLLIDGNAIMHRAYHAMPPLTTSDGIPTNVLYGFLSMLMKSVEDFHPTHLIVCFDTPKQTFRNKLLKSYQAHRPKIDDDFITQIPLVKDMLDAAGIARFEKDGYEADDVIGTLTRKFDGNSRVLILTGDKDIFQLINKNVSVVSPQFGLTNTKIYDTDAVVAKLGIPPEKIPDYKGLAGDPSDNYKGADGIGPKTAVKLIKEYGTVENILAHKNDLPEGKMKNSITNHIEDIKLSKELATIVTNVSIDADFQKTKFTGFEKQSLKEFLQKLEMRSLSNKIFFEKKAKPPVVKKESKEHGVQSELF